MQTRASSQVRERTSRKKETTTSHNRNRASENRGCVKNCGFRLPKRSGFSTMRFLHHLAGKISSGLRLVSVRRRPSSKVSTSDSGRSKQFVAPIDSQRAEAIEDCIQFINSSSSLPRSNSVSAKPT